MRIGETFFNKPAPGIPKRLWIMVSDPAHASGNVVIVNVSSDPGPEDDHTCVLKAGEHPTVVHTSYVRYAESRIVAIVQIKKGLQSGALSPSSDASPALVKRLQAGFASSPHAAQDRKQMLTDQGYLI